MRRRDSKWLASAIHGDVKRGTGILNNRRYIGVTLWGRSEWKRSAVDSSRRSHAHACERQRPRDSRGTAAHRATGAVGARKGARPIRKIPVGGLFASFSGTYAQCGNYGSGGEIGAWN